MMATNVATALEIEGENHKMLTLGPLDADYNLAGKFWRSDKQNRQFWSRVVLRCLCADIEARLYVFRRTALEVANLSKSSLTKQERETLNEMREVVENGNVKTKPKWLPIGDSIKNPFAYSQKQWALRLPQIVAQKDSKRCALPVEEGGSRFKASPPRPTVCDMSAARVRKPVRRPASRLT